MSKFSKPETGSQNEAIVKVVVDGSFLCQSCGEAVDSAFYLPEAKMLAWKCEQGHKSFIEKFEL